MAWWIWIVAGAVLLAAEVVISTDFYLVFLGLAAVVVGFLSLLGLSLPLWGEGLLFSVLAIASIVSYRRTWRKRLETTDRDLGPELVGELATAVAAIPPGGYGKVELRGASWEARNGGDAEIGEKVRCRVERVEGLTVVVRAEP